MKLIIDISEEDYKFIKDLQSYHSGRRSGKTIEQNVINGIKKGIPLEERPKGYWIFDSNFIEFGNPYGTYRCSCCDGHSSDKYSFCKDCGADMRRERE